ncbi:hypothetical protein N665_0086s0051 [Sinapis alba]|nr:hypothetical protein N665_0086s0051 [Sinapis alba]
MTSSGNIGDKGEKKILHAHDEAEVFFHKCDHVKVLKITKETISIHGTNSSSYRHHLLQGDVFFDLARTADGNDLKPVYLFASLDAYSASSRLCPESACSFHECSLALIELGDMLGLSKLHEKAQSKARLGLGLSMKIQDQSMEDDLQAKIEGLIDLAREKMKSNKGMDTTSVDNQIEEEKGDDDVDVDGLKLWSKMDEKAKRDFLVVDSRKFVDYLESMHAKTKTERRHFSMLLCIDDTLQYWRKWKCRICPQKHVQKFQPRRSSCSRPKRLDECFAIIICCGNWEPVDTAEAINLIKDKTEREEELIYVNGWSSEKLNAHH